MICPRKKRILLVDDHQVVLEALKNLLEERSDFEVVGSALDGVQALVSVESLVPDIVIMDISMPKLDVVAAVQEIRKRFSSVQVLIFTMSSDPQHIISLYQAGICGYVLKEQPVSELMHALETVSEGGVFYTKAIQQVVRRHMKGRGSTDAGERTPKTIAALSKREREVVPLLADGLPIKKIADRLCINPKTVESHKYNILKKLDLDSVAGLTKMAIKKGWIVV